jgi:nucleotide-binding universal stress UspA family protein
MTTPVVAAIDPQQPKQAHDAVTLAAQLADMLKAPLQAVHVFVQRRGDLESQCREHARSVSTVLEEAGATGEVMVYPGASPARVLHHLCDIEQARCVVIGSGRLASEGTSSLGDVAEALLHGSRVPVVIVPAGYGSPPRPIAHIAVAYGGTPESDAALSQAQELTAAVGGHLAVIAAEDATPAPDGGAVQGRLERALAAAPEATGVIADRDPATALAELSSAYDLLVAGSRSYGPLRVVLLGAVTRRVLELAHCPVMIVPRLPDAAHEVALVGGMEVALDAQAG